MYELWGSTGSSGSTEKQIVQDLLVPVIKFPNRRIKATNPSQTCLIPDWIELRKDSFHSITLVA